MPVQRVTLVDTGPGHNDKLGAPRNWGPTYFLFPFTHPSERESLRGLG
jgi:hypothetical protein